MNFGESSKLASIAIQYGPFFFSILFCIFLSRWGYTIYNKANVRIEPKPATPQELATYRLYFVATTIVGILLVVVSVIWWILQQNNVHVFKGKIINVEEKHEFVSSELYLKRIEIGEFGGSDSPIKVYDWDFFCIQREPFMAKRKFSLLHKKIGGKMEEATIQFSPQENLKYKIDFDAEKNKNYLKLIAGQVPQPAPAGLLFASHMIGGQQFTFQKTQYKPRVTLRLVLQKIETLQEESTELGKKIDCVDFLSSLGREVPTLITMDETIKRVTPKEPVILTLLDLSRHTDRELAYKAGRLVNQLFNVENYLKAGIQSNNSELHQIIELILFRIERERMTGLLNSIPQQQRNQFYRGLMARIEAGKKSRVLVPTGTARGDRYYIKAILKENNEADVLGLARLLKGTLPYVVNVQKEADIIREQKYRLFYLLTKERALQMAEQIESHHGTIEFVAMGYQLQKR